MAADHMRENQQYMLHEKPNYAGLALDDTHLSEISNEIKNTYRRKRDHRGLLHGNTNVTPF